MGRVLGFVGTIVTMAIGMYIYSAQVKTLMPELGAILKKSLPSPE